MSQKIPFGDAQGVTAERFGVLPVRQLKGCCHEARNHGSCCQNTKNDWRGAPPVQQFGHTPGSDDEQANQRNVSIAVGHRLSAGLDQANYGHERAEKPKPAHTPPVTMPRQQKGCHGQGE